MCLGGILSHERNWQFCSPFVNLAIPADEFVRLVNNLEVDVNGNFEDITNDSPYPIGLLAGKYHIAFIHYKSFNEAVTIWRKRAQRINFNNVYIILVQTETCSTQGLSDFDLLKYKKKIALVAEDSTTTETRFPIRGYDGKNTKGEILSPVGYFGQHLYDQFNWGHFFNK